MSSLDLASDSVFDHIRATDNELVGYIAMTVDGEFVPFDLLHRQAGPAGGLPEGEQLLEEIGLTLLAETYTLNRDGKEHVVGIKELTRTDVTVGPLGGDIDPASPQMDLTQRWTYALPAPELASRDH